MRQFQPSTHSYRNGGGNFRPIADAEDECDNLLEPRSSMMNKIGRPGLAIAAIFPAAMVPISMPALQRVAVSDLVRGVVVGALLGASLLLITLALKLRPA